jgi:hypothetical protein
MLKLPVLANFVIMPMSFQERIVVSNFKEMTDAVIIGHWLTDEH